MHPNEQMWKKHHYKGPRYIFLHLRYHSLDRPHLFPGISDVAQQTQVTLLEFEGMIGVGE